MVILLPSFSLQAQSAKETQKINVFLDCTGWCYDYYIRDEVNFVNFVRDKVDADIHLLISRAFAGSGGMEYTMRFFGRGEYTQPERTLTYQSYESDTEDSRRRGLVRTVKAGLIPFMTGSPLLTKMEINYTETTEEQQQEREDRWNSWIFEVGADTYLNGEDTRNELNLRAEVSAQRITKEWKIEFEYDQYYQRRTFTDEAINETFTTQNSRYRGLIAKSLNDHWSLGLFTDVISSSRSNYDLRIGGAPAIEYNIYPYEDYAFREFSFSYGLRTTYNDYEELTAFGKKEEVLFQNRFSTNIDYVQPWGEIEGDIDAFAYLNDMSKNRVEFELEFDFQVARGLSLRLRGRYSFINDQLSIPASDLTEEEQLLNLIEPPTSYAYSASVGFEYTFGSIYSNVVNSRF